MSSEFEPQPNAISSCPAQMFTQQAVVFDAVTLCATSKVSLDKLKHAANVTAKWLDNDEDGLVDEPKILDALRANKALLAMSERGFSQAAFERLEPELENRVGQDLAVFETAPVGERDASQEEIHHLIVNAGWQTLYPHVFSDNRAKASLLYQQWQQAEAKGYYAYDDPTCDDSCKTIEFFYLATAAYLGSEADLYSDEMRLKNRVELSKGLPEMITIIESDDYHYPKQVWPDGHYSHQQAIRYTTQ
ncbi:hypothetical protein C9I91_10395 [Photobacterium jeanii]|nr:hypothetical protein C9I91_10395 [Photobacterium jeanii]